MGRFNISPDEDSSSYSSNSDFNYSYPTKQAALKRWEKCALQKKKKIACTHGRFRAGGMAHRLLSNDHTRGLPWGPSRLLT